MSFPDEMSLVLVEWVDSNHTAGWRDAQEMRAVVTEGDLACLTVGYLLHDGEDRVVLVQSQSDTGMVDAAMTIPRAAVRSMRTLPGGVR